MSIFGGSILAVFLGTAGFVLSHVVMSHPLRPAMVRALGEKAFGGVYSLVVALFFAWMLYAYATAPYVELWGDPPWARHLLLLVMLPAVILLVLSLTAPNPTLGPQGPEKLQQGTALGAITRHAMLWSFALWAAGHMIANGDAATVIMTAGILILALGGAGLIDWKKRQALGPAYAAYMARTSFVPFAAVIGGRAKLDWQAIGLWRIALGVAAYVAILFSHGWIIGRSALPI
ncbi:MAG: NnrU family protein [Reyranellaceae bacterium]